MCTHDVQQEFLAMKDYTKNEAWTSKTLWEHLKRDILSKTGAPNGVHSTALRNWITQDVYRLRSTEESGATYSER